MKVSDILRVSLNEGIDVELLDRPTKTVDGEETLTVRVTGIPKPIARRVATIIITACDRQAMSDVSDEDFLADYGVNPTEATIAMQVCNDHPDVIARVMTVNWMLAVSEGELRIGILAEDPPTMPQMRALIKDIMRLYTEKTL